ncbi:MAG: AP endonuclease [Candidatus Hydrothermarchaeota archaeon]|nr:MAG: AP endonuclease [Candidatus Hydrothermarchaeota archaeon]
MIRFGPSGIPLSCKGRTLRDGIEDVHTLGLTALEVQIVRTNVADRFATEDDIGIKPIDIEDELIIEVLRGTGKNRKIAQLDEPIQKGDLLLSMINPIARNYQHLREMGEIAKNLDVVLSVHTPYYMDLVANNDLTESSIDSIRWAGILAQAMDAEIVVTHLGMYGEFSLEEATANITENIALIQDWYDEFDIKVPLGLETSGRQEIFGDFDEIVNICKTVKGPIPVINFPHVHARGNGALKKKEDFQELFEKVKRFGKGKYYTHFSGVEHEGGNEIRYTPIKKGDLKFEPLAECILDNDFDMVIISGSPLLEHDAMYMKVILERVLAKREAKAERQKLKEAEKEAEEKAKAEKEKAEAKKKPAAKKKTPAKKKSSAKDKEPAKKSAKKKSPAKKKAEPKKDSTKKASKSTKKKKTAKKK